ncbi:MAG: CD225/dispanin family protein [Bacteroides sp.]|nr:CD225/dispanin family protein [Bacteroides sp.]MCM1548366.1 CD225/dispanin family protein [Clostridium sp.]
MVPENKFGLMLGLSIAELVCCFPICGIIGIIFAVLANNAYKEGDYTTYEKQAKTVKITLIVGLIVGLIMNILVFVMYGAAIFSAAGSSYY